MARNALNTVDASRNGVQSVEPNLKCKQLGIVRRLLKQLLSGSSSLLHAAVIS